MPTNPNIIQVQPIRSPANYMSDVLTMRNARQTNQMNQAKLDAYGREQDRQNKLLQVLGGLPQGATDDDRVGALRNNGYLDEADKVQTGIISRKNAESQALERGAKAAKDNEDVKQGHRKLIGNALRSVMDNPTPERANIALDYLQMAGLPQAEVDKLRQHITEYPEAIKDLATSAFSSINDPKDLLYKETNQDTGGSLRAGSYNPLSGVAQFNSTTLKTQDPNNLANNARMAADAAAGRGVAMRGQDMTDARQRDANGTAAGMMLADAGGPSQAAFTKQFGKAPAGFRWKADGSMESIPGGPADRKANEQTAGKETVDSVVASLRSSYDTLDKGGGITSTSKGPLDNIAATVSKSGIGQFAGGAVGSQNQKERDAIAQTRPLLLQAIMKATGMSAKQMDSNAELKLYLATATDPTLSLQANREALDRIEQLYGSGALTKPASKTVVRTGTSNGRKVIQYSDGSISYAD